MLITSIFYFSHSVSTLSETEIIILAMFNLSSAKAFNLDQSEILLFGRVKYLRKNHVNGVD